MICHHQLIGCLVCLALITRLAAAGQAGQGEPTEVGVMVEHIQLGSQAASQLLRAYEGDGSALQAQLQEMVERDEAQVLDGTYIRTRSLEPVAHRLGQRVHLPDRIRPAEPAAEDHWQGGARG